MRPTIKAVYEDVQLKHLAARLSENEGTPVQEPSYWQVYYFIKSISDEAIVVNARSRGGDNVEVESGRRDAVFIEVPVRPFVSFVPVLSKGRKPRAEVSEPALRPGIPTDGRFERSRNCPSAQAEE